MLTSAWKCGIPAFTGISRPIEVDFLENKTNAPDLQLKAVISPAADKLDTLFAVLCKIVDKATLVFCNLRAILRISIGTGPLTQYLRCFLTWHGAGGPRTPMIKFRNSSHRLLITLPDRLASRGLDIPRLNTWYITSCRIRRAFLHRNVHGTHTAKGTSYLILTGNRWPT